MGGERGDGVAGESVVPTCEGSYRSLVRGGERVERERGLPPTKPF